LIADIDSPRGGRLKVAPQNLLVLEQFLKPNDRNGAGTALTCQKPL
jgi:hypothetical protein